MSCQQPQYLYLQSKVPTIKGSYHVFNGVGRKFKDHEALEAFLRENSSNIDSLLGIMGGRGQAMFVLAQQIGLPIYRIPWFRLEEITDLSKGASETERATAVEQAWGTNPEAFYEPHVLDPTIFMMRELTRVRKAIQDTYRKPAQQMYAAAFRDIEPLLPEQGGIAALRTTFASSPMIEGALADEKALTDEIKRLVRDLPIWKALHPGKNSVLPEVKGFGPNLGGAIIGELGTTKRFRSATHMRAYARLHVKDGEYPHRRRGEVSNWNGDLYQAIWFWSSDQMPRYDHVWRALYDWYKAVECERHPEPVIRQLGGGKTVTVYTLGHIDKRAKRWVASKLFEYLYGLWSTIEDDQDPEVWYVNSAWPQYFADVQRELDEGKMDFLKAQIQARRKEVPDDEQED